MPTDRRERLTFENGLLESVSESGLPNTFAADLVNLVPQAHGGLRCRTGWLKANSTGIPATRKGRGIGYLALQETTTVPYFRQVREATRTAAASVRASFLTATIAGNLLIGVVFLREDAATPEITITPPSGWSTATTTARLGGRDWRLGIFYRQNAPSVDAGEVLTFSFNATAESHLHIYEYAGITTLAALDVTATNNGIGTAVTTGTTAATASANELWLAVVGTAGARVSSVSTEFTNRASTSTTNLLSRSYEHIPPATGAASMAATLFTSSDWVAAIVTFKPRPVPQTGERLVVAHDNSTDYKFYYIDANALAGGSWGTVETVVITPTTRPVAFASGLSNLFFSTRDFATLRRWDGTTAASVAAGPAARCLAFHHNRIFAGGTTANPSRLSYSDFGDYATWGANSYIDVSKDDGEPIEDIAVVSDGLLIAKPSSLHHLSGVGPQTFELHPVQGGGGAPGRCIVATPYGTVVAGTRNVFMVEGFAADESFSEGIENSYCIEGEFVTTAYVNRTVFICDEGTGMLWAYDFVKRAWWTETVDSNIDAPAVIAAHGNTLLYSPKEGTTARLLGYRVLPLCLEPHVKDESLVMRFVLKTPEYWLGGPSTPVSHCRLYLLLRQRSGNAAGSPLTVTPTFDGIDQTPITVELHDAEGTYRQEVPLGGEGVYSVQVEVSRETTTDETGLVDIEAAELHFQQESPR